MLALCNTTTIKTGGTAFLISTGQTAGHTVGFYSGPPAGPDGNIGSTTVTANGNAVLSYTSALVTTDHVYLHDPDLAPIANRVDGPLDISWVSTGSNPAYGTAPVLFAAIPGDTKVTLVWNDALGCDVNFDSATYTVQRSTTGPTSGFSNVATGLTTLVYMDTGRTNGTTYWYRIEPRLSYFSGDVIIGTPFTGQTALRSNVLSVVPRGDKGYLGTFANG